MKQDTLPSLSFPCPMGVKFINTLQGKTVFTLNEAAVVYGKSKQLTSRFLRTLIQQDIITPLVPGKYIFLHSGPEGNVLPHWSLIARELVGKHPYIITHHSALWLHNLTALPPTTVYITAAGRVRNKTIKGTPYNFLVYSEKDFAFGTTVATIHGKPLIVSNIERTLLEAFERRELSGGIKNVIYSVWAAKDKIDWDRLIEYSADFRTIAAVKRLAYTIEILAIAPQHLPILKKITAPSQCYICLDPSGPKTGRCLIRWHIRVNVNIDEILKLTAQADTSATQPAAARLLNPVA